MFSAIDTWACGVTVTPPPWFGYRNVFIIFVASYRIVPCRSVPVMCNYPHFVAIGIASTATSSRFIHSFVLSFFQEKE